MSIDDFLTLVQAEVGLPLGAADLDTDFDDLVAWDSVHLLKLLTALEGSVGARLPVPQLLESRSLRQVHGVLVTR
ncbi:MAG TPA: acyl carrier protein [Pseudonocardiaceae bacterium]